ncbi:MAG: hypothetical protein CVV64_19395 [Candidatus Wallbacteria bacterium HGW-Wallbacteria-1]|jgi:CheY-like chemotaxis protein|uniref:Response regulatory domain-containing protein n=1 Tax=Candidatus Wallbacteria bacterium HGW-Wallbacteria-1 TaxID=2013854 RepID=A0A2N1PIZ5_9BACT|nr:MAG: hypothetical protein CVV64_19395 [Candidatus Wallbacteria bacterium HGW-Wallbacteria-1]
MKTALLAEDCMVNIQLVSSFLRAEGFRVDPVHDGLSAVEKCSEKTYDLIVMDIKMPRLSGFEAIRRIRVGEGPNRGTPIIVITGYLDRSDEMEITELGVSGIAFKPFRKKDLNTLISHAMNRTPTVDRVMETPRVKADDVDIEDGNDISSDSENGHEQVMDYDLALEEFDNDTALFGEVIEFFMRDSRLKIQTIIQALSAGDYEKMRVAAHTLRGGAANMRANPISVTAGEIEEWAGRVIREIKNDSDISNETNIRKLLSRLSMEHGSLIKFIKAEMAERN